MKSTFRFSAFAFLFIVLIAGCDNDESSNSSSSRASTGGTGGIASVAGAGHNAASMMAPSVLEPMAGTPSSNKAPPSEGDVGTLILEAGSTDDDQIRYELMTTLSQLIEPGSSLEREYAALMPIIDRWANGRESFWMPGEQSMAGEGGYLANFFVNQVWPNQTNFPAEITSTSPLYPIWCLYRARMLVWTAIQSGFLVDQYFTEARALFEVAAAAFPDNPIIGMYLDQPIPWPVPFEMDDDAPRWANLQRIALYKLNDIIGFWITERQAPDGQFGGGWGDDVEMWRWWSPLLLGFDNTRMVEATRTLADSVFELDRMADGFSNILTDVEHSAEDSSDTITPMLLLDPKSETWQARAGRIGELMNDVWLGRNTRGQRQFKSAYVSSAAVSDDADKACDTPYHARATQPVLLRLQQTGDESARALLGDWLDTWVDATRREEGGKPADIVPAAIEYPSGSAGGPGGNWHDPGCHINPATFRFPRAYTLLTTTMAVFAAVTNSPRYLEPIRSAARDAGLADKNAPVGSHEWAVAQIGNKWVPAATKYRQLTGDEQFDDALRAKGSAYVRARLTDDYGPVEQALEALVTALSVDRAAHTSEVRFTDRIFKFHKRYADEFRSDTVGGIDTTLLYSMVTGDWTHPGYGAAPAVRWTTSPRDIAILVTDDTPDLFRARLYNFSADPRPIGGHFFRLNTGEYRWTLTPKAAMPLEGQITIDENSRQLTIDTLPSGESTLTLAKWES